MPKRKNRKITEKCKIKNNFVERRIYEFKSKYFIGPYFVSACLCNRYKLGNKSKLFITALAGINKRK